MIRIGETRMGFVEIEAVGKAALEQFPGIKHAAKRVYQRLSVATDRSRVKSEGDIIRVSPDDEYEYFYGYYDKSPWDSDDRYMICVRVQQAYKSVAPKEPGTVCLVDTAENNRLIEIGTTHSWNVQQSCMAQWLGPDYKSHIIYNDFRNGAYCSVIFNVDNMKEEKVLPIPVYDVSRDGTLALSLDFNRLHRMRPGYGYSNMPDKTKGILCPDECCIWKMEVPSGKTTELYKYTDFASFEPDGTMNGAEHKVNHLMISPNGKRFMVLHRWFDKGRKHTRLVTASTNGSDMYNLSDDVFVSHCFWKNDNEILSFLRKKDTGDHYYLMRDKTHDYKMYWPELNTDGHCSYSPDGKYIITDTYPNRKRIASVFLCTEDDNKSRRIARVFSPFKYDNDCRCDLHPRWNRESNKICIDSVHEGKRGLYVIPVKETSNYLPMYDDNPISEPQAIDFEKTISEIKEYKHISFDIFDTLLKRDVSKPVDVFDIIQDQAKKDYGITIHNFKEKRIQAEREARKVKGDKEVSIREIYNAFNDNEVIKNIDLLISLEEQVEIKISCVNPYIKKIYDAVIELGKRVFIISDMYLPKDLIIQLLEANGIREYEQVFISSEVGYRKANNGELFKYACEKMKIQPSQLVHVGDSMHSDYQMAKRVGCTSILIPKNLGYAPYYKSKIYGTDNKIQYQLLQSFTQNRPEHLKDEYYAFGYEVFGPLLKGFTDWLYHNIKSEGISKVYFFARDGLILKNAFDTLYGDKGIETCYLRVSRRSLRVPQIWMKPEYEDVISTFPAASMQSILTFFDTIGLEYREYEEICKKKGIGRDYVYKKSEMLSNETLASLYEDIKDDVIKNSKEEYSALIKYLQSNHFEGNVAVVDIGWRGSMQVFLMGICDAAKINTVLHGYYIGIGEGADVYAKKVPIQFKGYVFDVVNNPGTKDLRQPFVGLVETLFLARTGSTKKYIENGKGQIEVVLYDNEYEIEKGILSIDAQKVEMIQKGGLRFIDDARNSILNETILNPEVAFENLRRIGMQPTSNELEQFGDMDFIDGITLRLAAPKPLIKYMIKPKALIKDFYNSRWKIGFMKRLLKVPIPYERVYDILKKRN